MKTGYKKLLIYELFIIIILMINSFTYNILNIYNRLIFLILLIIIFKIYFGHEKEKKRYVKDLNMETIIFLIVFLMLYYLLGLIITYAKVNNYYTFESIKTIIIPLILYIYLKEYLRYIVICKTEYNNITKITTIILFILLDISNTMYIYDFRNSYKILLFIGLILLPSISNNIVFSILTEKTGYKPIILYLLIINLYKYLFPIIPNPNEYLLSIINLLLPILYYYHIYNFFKKEKDEFIESNYKKDKKNIIITLFLIMIIVYLTSGYFKYWSLAIASNSMKPIINKGDVVILKKIDNEYNELKEGDVIVFKYQNIIIVHRLVKIIKENNEYYFYTKGDNNENIDNFVIKENMIIGKVKIQIPFIGIPTVLINEYSN